MAAPGYFLAHTVATCSSSTCQSCSGSVRTSSQPTLVAVVASVLKHTRYWPLPQYSPPSTHCVGSPLLVESMMLTMSGTSTGAEASTWASACCTDTMARTWVSAEEVPTNLSPYVWVVYVVGVTYMWEWAMRSPLRPARPARSSEANTPLRPAWMFHCPAGHMSQART